MDKNLQDIEDLFYSNLEDNEETPSAKVWEAVDKQLDKETVISIKRKYTNLKRVAVLLLLMFLSFVLFEVNKSYNNEGLAGNDNEKTGSKNNTAVKKIPGSNEKQDDNSNSVNGSAAAENNINEKTSADALTTDKENKLFPEQNSSGQADNNQLPENVFRQKTITQKDITKNQSDLITTSGRRKKLTTKQAYKVTIKNATAVADDENTAEVSNGNSENRTTSTGKLKDVAIENVKPDKSGSTDTEKISESVSLAKLKAADSSINAIVKVDKKNPRKSSKFSFTPFFSPDIAWYRLKDDKVGNQNQDAKEFEREEKHEFSSTFGMLIDYKINKHWGLQSGATLSNTNIIIEPKTIYAQPDNAGNVKYRINTSSGYGYVLPAFSSSPVIGDSLFAFTSTHSLQYLGIPLAVTYNITKGKFKFSALAGLSANILTKARLETNVEKGFDNSLETVNNIEGLKKMYISGLTGVGVDYKLTRKTSLIFAPTMRFALNSINKDATVKSYPMSMGFVAGIKIGL